MKNHYNLYNIMFYDPTFYYLVKLYNVFVP